MKRASQLLAMPIMIWAMYTWNFSPPGAEAQFDYRVKFYSEECPQARELVKDVVLNAITADKGLSAALLRLNFHDCFIRGCDASVLLDSNFTNVAEKDGFGNMLSLRGYRVIDDAKAAVEAVCPEIVSCADILTLAARDAITAIGGPAWRIASGRRDGVVSFASETIDNLPAHYSDFADLTRLFTKKNFTAKEMVVLAGEISSTLSPCSGSP
ncbi:hypothetical protein Mapa_001497 [Marchantia paleacea]|nr:hypothetical protein Mapa_001497 [Marchantia paleacea]